MSFFFNGRLWISPAVMSVVNDSAMFNQNPQVGNIACFIGQSSGGQPNVALSFGSPAQAAAALISGDLYDACTKAFNPSNDTAGPSTVVAIRANPALQSTLTLLNAGATAVIVLTSADYGIYTTGIQAKVQPGSIQGLALSVALGNVIYTQDNVYNAPFSIQYTGTQPTANITITPTTMTLFAPAGTAVATFNLSLASLNTVSNLVAAINTIPGFVASVTGGNGNAPTLNGLDNQTTQDVKTAQFAVTAILQAAINWFNSGAAGGLVTAARSVGAGTVPAAIPFTNLAGGVDGTVTNTQWANAFTALQSIDVQWLTPLSPTPAIWAMGDAHCQFMSVVGRKERRQFVGENIGTTDLQAIADALTLNSDRTSLLHLGYFDFNQQGVLTLFPPYKLAAIFSAAFSGVNPGVAMTNKSLTIRGLERNLRNPTDTDPLITGGVLPVEATSTGFRVVQSISTWLTDSRFDKVEQSVGAALDFVSRSVRQALNVLKGAQGTPANLQLAVSITETTLRLLAKPVPAGIGVLVGNAASPAYKNITASLIGNVLAVQFQCSPVIPINYIPITIFAVPFAGVATASSTAQTISSVSA